MAQEKGLPEIREALIIIFPVSWLRPHRTLSAEFRTAAEQLGLKPLHDRTVHLAHPTFREIERRADFLHRQFFVIIKDDN